METTENTDYDTETELPLSQEDDYSALRTLVSMPSQEFDSIKDEYDQQREQASQNVEMFTIKQEMQSPSPLSPPLSPACHQNRLNNCAQSNSYHNQQQGTCNQFSPHSTQVSNTFQYKQEFAQSSFQQQPSQLQLLCRPALHPPPHSPRSPTCLSSHPVSENNTNLTNQLRHLPIDYEAQAHPPPPTSVCNSSQQGEIESSSLGKSYKMHIDESISGNVGNLSFNSLTRYLGPPQLPPSLPPALPPPVQAIIPEDLRNIASKGKYLFDVVFEVETRQPTKSCPFTWSDKLSRLFVKPKVDVPFNIKTRLPLPVKSTEIKVFLKYKDTRWDADIIEMCPDHVKEFTGPKEHSSHSFHQVRKEAVEYVKCPKTGRYVVAFPPVVTTSTTSSFTEQLRFYCSSSCKGGVNRRAISIIFCLYISNKLEGHKCIDINIVACPGRDRKTYEEKDRKEKLRELGQLKREATSSQPCEPSTSRTRTDTPSTSAGLSSPPTHSARPTLKRVLSSSSDEEQLRRPPQFIYYSNRSDEDNRLYEIKRPVQIRGKAQMRALAHFLVALGMAPTTEDLNIERVDKRKPPDPSEAHTNGQIAIFEKLKKKYNVQATTLERSTSDRTQRYSTHYRNVSLQHRSDLNNFCNIPQEKGAISRRLKVQVQIALLEICVFTDEILIICDVQQEKGSSQDFDVN